MAKKGKNVSAVGLFFSFFLKAVVIILGLVILAMGVYLIKNGLMNKEEKTEKAVDDSVFTDDQSDELLTEASNDIDNQNENVETKTTESPVPDDEVLLYEGDGAEEGGAEAQDGSGTKELALDDKIIVLNATEVAGLAAAWKGKVAEKGYTNVETGNYTGGKLDSSKIVVTEEGTGGELKSLIENAGFETASADSISCDVSTEGVKAFIIIGNSDNILAGQ